ncbi:predicted protein [Aspergillus terreus NIH2624]|uniref:Uncharacterized protein n=1 Tax=Aspergillus terreus (strain NIH 2624 / FGSC A1156) TaxID=341663 RepID=Q0CKA4_ASPTN|nr:uncharacterized protein ATEG_05880 [Aspergillus terreus NIH2624]EAU33641.1 predicted protein [Aspergillus terreus NIH2624]
MSELTKVESFLSNSVFPRSISTTTIAVKLRGLVPSDDGGNYLWVFPELDKALDPWFATAGFTLMYRTNPLTNEQGGILAFDTVGPTAARLLTQMDFAKTATGSVRSFGLMGLSDQGGSIPGRFMISSTAE